MDSYFKKDFALFMISSQKFLELLDDLDRILKTNRDFLLGPWIEASKALGSTEDEKTLLEYNARIQVCLHDTSLLDMKDSFQVLL